MLQAMNTGHDGSLTTVHANSPRDVLSRLETMVLMAGVDIPMRAIREQISSAINLIVHQSRLKDGTRRLTHITEIVGMEGDVITLQDIYTFDYRAGIDENGRFRGIIQPTGLRPRFLERLSDHGIHFDADLFTSDNGTSPWRCVDDPPNRPGRGPAARRGPAGVVRVRGGRRRPGERAAQGRVPGERPEPGEARGHRRHVRVGMGPEPAAQPGRLLGHASTGSRSRSPAPLRWGSSKAARVGSWR